tara:strand:- start:170 stop:397 length:228 start_codon:yes stop_codon:yes gene_type:complete
VIIGKLTIEVTYTEGVKNDEVDVANVLRAAADHITNRGHLTEGLYMPADGVQVEVKTEYKPETQQRLDFPEEEDE